MNKNNGHAHCIYIKLKKFIKKLQLSKLNKTRFKIKPISDSDSSHVITKF
jgi:hypothetical protein